jgi:hypothetical protein
MASRTEATCSMNMHDDWTALVDADDPYDDYSGPPVTDEELAYYEAEEARGELAGSPDTLDCYECMGFDGVNFIARKVTALGPVVDRADPTQTYELECGHFAI